MKKIEITLDDDGYIAGSVNGIKNIDEIAWMIGNWFKNFIVTVTSKHPGEESIFLNLMAIGVLEGMGINFHKLVDDIIDDKLMEDDE